jgi:tetratricopeptide (TPR) repeat protein
MSVTDAPASRGLGAAAGLVALVVLAFGGVARNGFVWDDRALVVANEALARPDVVVRAFQMDTWRLADPLRPPDAFYRPLGVLSLALDRWLGGGSALPFHLHALALHAAVVLLLHAVLRRRGVGRWPALAAAGWFATLPASVEAVAWVAVRFDLLAAALALLALLLHRSPRPAARLATPLLVLAATLTKEAAFVLPALLALDDWLEERPAGLRPFLQDHLVKYAGLAAAVAASLGLRAAALQGGGPGALAGRSVGILAVDGLSTLAELARLAVAPFPLSVTRPYQPLGAAGLALAAALAAAGALAAWRVAGLRLGLAWFAIGCALPSLVVRPLGFVGERYLYFPAIGLALAGAAAAALLRGASARRAAGAVAALVVAAQAGACWARVPDWRDDRALFGAALEADPRSWFALFELGHADARDGRWPEAAAWYRRALALNRTDGRLLSNAAAAFDTVGDWAGAVEVGRLAVAAAPASPRARYNLALPLARLGRLAEARAELDAALALAPGYAKARALRDQLGRGGEAPPRGEPAPGR